MSSATTYNIELRDKDNHLKQYLTPWVTNVKWEWNRIGGCGRCSITLGKGYRDINFGPHDDIQIRIKSGATSKLVYRGYIENINPTLKVNQTITLDVRGYFDLLKKIVIHTSGSKKTYTNTIVSSIVDSIVDTYVVANTDITKGTIDAGIFSIDSIQFRGSVDESLRTLAELQGDVEYGVDEDLVFFWRTESATLRHKFFVGNNVELLERRINWEKLVNRVIFQGGDVSGAEFIKTADASDSQTAYFLAEQIMSNSAIITDSVADQYLGAILRDGSQPVLNLRAKIPNTTLRFEDTIPMGEVGFYDVDHDQSRYVWGTTANSGSNLIWGKAGAGGSGAVWGSFYHAQIDRISYDLSDTTERFNIEIQLGDTILETSAKIKRLEHDLANLRER